MVRENRHAPTTNHLYFSPHKPISLGQLCRERVRLFRQTVFIFFGLCIGFASVSCGSRKPSKEETPLEPKGGDEMGVDFNAPPPFYSLPDSESPSVDCSTAVEDSFLGGNGTDSDPFIICLREHLNLIGDTSKDSAYTLSAHYQMGQNIDLEGISFTPIPGPFTGVFDGNGKKIINLTIASTGDAGLFLKLGINGDQKGTIKNLGIEEFSISTTSKETVSRVGALVALSDGGIIAHCYAIDSDEDRDLLSNRWKVQ